MQEVADLVGDSLELARAAAKVDADVIVFAGVDFMAETAAILSPTKTVLLPAADACCPMAEMISAGEVRVLRERFPEAAVVAYVNTSADVKAESDICCTSANAVAVVESLDAEEVIFLPDRNLGRYVARFTKKEILPWEGYCIVHDRMTADEVLAARRAHPEAEVLVHPECRPEVIDLADHVFSTSGMVRHACDSPRREFIIGTEVGSSTAREEVPGKGLHPLEEGGLRQHEEDRSRKVLAALERCEPRVTVPEETAARARAAIRRMLDVPIP